jgi:NAD(P)-dependent dehydrogenase (short-subunit alcohol dehydrogenase family)
MQNNTVLLTGVSQGLGLYLCKELIKHNFKIIGIDLPDKNKLSPDLLKILTNYYSFDLSNTIAISKLINEIISENGNIHILINNAGIKSFKQLTAYSDEEYCKVVNVNFLAPVMLAKQLLPSMDKQEYGRIINIASNAGFEGYRTGSAYCSTKGALHLFTQAVAQELSKGITINTISPSTIATAEHIKSHPGINPGNLISPQKIASIIMKIIDGDLNGRVIPVIDFKTKIKYLLGNIRQNLYWLIRT